MVFGFNYRKNYFLSVGCTGLLSFLLVGCENQQYSECQELIVIANQVSQKAQKVSNLAMDSEVKTATWLQIADSMSLAAKEIAALAISDSQLVNYQTDLANLFQSYSESTYDAIEARKLKDKSALMLAGEKAQKASELNSDLAEQINRYCGEQ